jgi:transcription antitermination factor NusG
VKRNAFWRQQAGKMAELALKVRTSVEEAEMEQQWKQWRWYVVHCQALKERQVASALQDLLGLTIYLPEVTRRYAGKIQMAPFFPRYLFVRANLHEVPPSTINAIPGVARMVTLGDEPQPVPAKVLAAIAERLADLEKHGGLPMHNHQPGDAVQLRSGPLRGLDAIFLGPAAPSERVRILVEFLGQPREVDIEVAMIEGSRGGAASQGKRRTRGKGRHINRHVHD